MENENKTLNFQVIDVEKIQNIALEKVVPLYQEMISNGFKDGEILMFACMLAVDMTTAIVALKVSDNSKKELSDETKESIWQDAKKLVIDIIQKLPLINLCSPHF